MSDLCCSLCNMKFAKANSLSRHKRRSHPEKPPQKFVCFHCGLATVYKNNLYKHMNKVHLSKDGALTEKRVSSWPLKVCSLCSTFECVDRNKMIDHYLDSHNVPINRQILNFNSFSEFLSWKLETESQESSRFVLASSQRKRLKKHIWFYRCFRDGRYMPRGTGQRSLKVKGSVKIGSVCPWSIKVTKTLDTGAVSGVYITPHVGHEPDVSRLSLTKEQRDFIASKISAGVPDDELLTSLRDSMSFVGLSRLHLITRKDLWNIKNALIHKKSERDEHTMHDEMEPLLMSNHKTSDAGEPPRSTEMKRALSSNIQKTSEAGGRTKDEEMKPALITDIREKSEAEERTKYAVVKPALITDIREKSEAEERTKYAVVKPALITKMQKKSEADERTKYEEMKRALYNNISSLIDSTKNCAQLEVIRKAFLPLPEAVKALESGLSTSTNSSGNLGFPAKITENNLKRNRSMTKTNQPMNTAKEEHSANYVLSDVNLTIYTQDVVDRNSENEFQGFYE